MVNICLMYIYYLDMELDKNLDLHLILICELIQIHKLVIQPWFTVPLSLSLSIQHVNYLLKVIVSEFIIYNTGMYTKTCIHTWPLEQVDSNSLLRSLISVVLYSQGCSPNPSSQLFADWSSLWHQALLPS